jgi:deoxyribonuclease V
MRPKHDHAWDVSPYEAQQIQKELQSLISEEESPGKILTIAGVQVAQSRFSDTLIAAVSVLNYPAMTLVEEAVAELQTQFPYIPGLLSFREGPAVLKALSQLKNQPDLLMVDGPGLAHPHGLGLASHLGVLLDIPTIGCSRTSMVGSYVEPEVSAGSQTSLVWQGRVIGTVYRSKNRVAPLFISVGHRISRLKANEFVIAACQGYRLPEPTRLAQNALSSARLSLKATAESVI